MAAHNAKLSSAIKLDEQAVRRFKLVAEELFADELRSKDIDHLRMDVIIVADDVQQQSDASPGGSERRQSG
ncbi:hypothetical protein ABQE57_23190 [Mycolicibacterium elephantis]